MKYVLGWAGEQPISKNYFWLERYIYHGNVVGNVVSDQVMWSDGGYLESYFSDNSIKEMNNDGEKLLNPKNALSTIRNSKKAIENFWKTTKIISKEFNKNHSLKKMQKWYGRFYSAELLIAAHFITSREEVMYAVECTLYNHLVEKIGEKQAQNMFGLLTTPVHEDLVFRELKDTQKVLKNPSIKNILTHLRKYPFLAFNIDSEQKAIVVMKKRFIEESLEKARVEIQNSIKRRKELKKKQKHYFERLKESRIKQLAVFVQQSAINRLELKACWAGAEYYLLPFFRKISEIAKCSLKDLLMFYTPKDIKEILNKGNLVSSEELQARKKYMFVHYHNQKIDFYAGEKALQAKQSILDPSLPGKETKEFNGMIANMGKFVGKAKLVKVDNMEEIQQIAKTLTKEHILVAGMTNPNMTVLVKKVGGIITDEGGMACHAAIISREFNLPCLVGCKIATLVLQDNDLIELDANNGVVKIIKKVIK